MIDTLGRPGMVLVLLLALVAYSTTLTLYPSGGYTSDWLYRNLPGKALFPSPHPASGWLLHRISGFTPLTIYRVAGVLNLLFTLAGLAYFYGLMCRLPLYDADDSARRRMKQHAAWWGTVMLAFSPGIWMAATRPGPNPLGFLLATMAAHGCWHSARSGRRAKLGFFSALLGLAIIEAPPLLLPTIPVLFMLGGSWWLDRSRRPLVLPLLLGLGTGVGLGFIVMAGLAHVMDSTISWRVVAAVWRTETLFRLFPLGWLAIALISGGTLFLSLYAAIPARKRAHRRTRWIQVLLLAGLLAAFITDPGGDGDKSNGRRLFYMWPFFSVSFGVSMAFIIKTVATRSIGPGLQRVLVLVISMVIMSASLVRWMEMNPRNERVLHDLHGAALEQTASDVWVLSEGWLDAPLWLTTSDRHSRITFLHAAGDHHRAYRHWLARSFEDLHYRTLAGVGVGALLAERRFRGEPDASVVALRDYSPLIIAGYRPIPRAARYDGAPRGQQPEAGPEYTRALAFWEDIEAPLERLARRANAAGRHAARWRSLLSRLANDLGVHAEQQDRPELAVRCYQQALRFKPENVSARINQRALGTATEVTEDALQRELAGRTHPVLLASLVDEYGLIHRRATIERIEEMTQEDQRTPSGHPRAFPIVQLALSGKIQQAYAAARAFAQEEPDEAAGWLLATAFAPEVEQAEITAEATRRADPRNPDWTPLWVMLGERALRHGEPDAAERYFEQALRHWPLNLRVQESLLKIALHRNDAEKLDRRLRALLAIDPGNPWGNLALGFKLLKEGDDAAAERILLAAVGRTSAPLALNNLAWLLVRRGETVEALHYARLAINQEPYGAAQWDTLSSILLERKEWTAAGVALQTALRLDPENPASAVHYTYWKRQTGKQLPEGEASLATFDANDIPDDPRLRRLWDTRPLER